MKNEDNIDLLELFYSDKRRWSYTFQNCAVLSRFKNIENAIKNKANGISNIFITERCLDTDYQVFAKMLRDDKLIDALEFTLYEKWFSLLKETATPLSAIIYIDTKPEVCAERIITRGRDEEKSIPLDYLKNLTIYQNKWIDSLNGKDSNIKNINDKNLFPCIRAVTVDKIEEFITTLQYDSMSRCTSVSNVLLRSNSITNISPSESPSIILNSCLEKFNKKINNNSNEYGNEILVSSVSVN